MNIKDIIIYTIDAYIVFHAIVAWINDIDDRKIQGEFFPRYRLSKRKMFCYKIMNGVKYSIFALIIIIMTNYSLGIMLT